MLEKDALEALVSACVVPVRMGSGVDTEAVENLAAALEGLESDLAGCDQVPKYVAFLLHELMVGLEASIPLYDAQSAASVGEVLLRLDALIQGVFTS